MPDEIKIPTPDEYRKLFSLPSQDEVNYSPAGGTTNHMCSNCRFFQRNTWDGTPQCYLISNWPEPIEPTGICDRHETGTPEIVEVVPVPVVIVEPDMMEDDSAEMSLTVPKSIFQRVKEFTASLLPRATPEPQAFSVFKTATGKNAWIARHTGKWVDREGEILSEKSHEDYVERVQKGITPMPELWMWHAKGTKHGQAVAVWKSGGFVLAAGLFDETPAGEKAFAYYQKHSGKIKLSHMFHYPRETKQDGVYHAYNTVEITTLPDGAEAFPYTSFEEIQTMALTKEAESMIGEALGQDVLQRAREADSKALDDTKALDAQGVAWKGYDKYGDTFAPTEKISALETSQKSIEETLKTMGDLVETVKALNTTVKTLQDELATSRSAENTALEKINALELKLAEQTELKAPASQSGDTLLNQREKSLIDSVMEAAKSQDAPSLIETLTKSQPYIHS